METAIWAVTDYVMGNNHRTPDEHGATLDDRTRLSWGIVAAVVGAIFTLAVLASGAVWWAGQFTGGVTAKLTSIETMLQQSTANDTRQQSELEALKVRANDIDVQLRVLRENGTPALAAQMKALEKQMAQLDESVKIYQATAGKANKP